LSIGQGLSLCEELSARFAEDRALLVPVLITQARLLGLRGDLGIAGSVLSKAGQYAEHLHLTLAGIAVTQVLGLIESLAGECWHSADLFRRAAALALAAGQPALATKFQVYAAREVFRSGQVVMADEALCSLETAVSGPDLGLSLVARALRAQIDSQLGRSQPAVAAAQEVIRAAELTDDPCLRGDALFQEAQVLRAAGNTTDATAAARSAMASYRTKGADLPAGWVVAWLGGETDVDPPKGRSS
jgi:hypothetical protein